jgi:hypothetical protein
MPVPKKSQQLLIKKPGTIDLKIAENTRFGIDTDVERTVQTNGRNVDCHLPAMHFAGNKHG